MTTGPPDQLTKRRTDQPDQPTTLHGKGFKVELKTSFISWFEDLTVDDVPRVGGKNASLGEMIRELREEGVRVPGGFATTADAYRGFLAHNDLSSRLADLLEAMDAGEIPVRRGGEEIRDLIRGGSFPPELSEQIRSAYRQLSERYDRSDLDVAVRSSATAEDLPTASFAGQQETYLNVSGEENLLEACRDCFASLFTDRAIAYRKEKGFEHMDVALSVGIQKMVRSDRAGSGVMFTLETESGFPGVVVVNAAWGLGETVVQGSVNPDEYEVFKPLLDREQTEPIVEKILGDKEQKLIYAEEDDSTTRLVETSPEERDRYVLSDREILRLARWGAVIEDHYERPMDVEWAKDGEDGELYILQARPETVQSQKRSGTFRTYRLTEHADSILSGLSIGDAVATGRVSVIHETSDIDRFEEGEILVTGMTQPDWVPIMKKAAGIITDEGGRTCHAAIVSRELGTPAVVGTGNATEVLEDGEEITLSCAEGEIGHVYPGELNFETIEHDLDAIPETRTRIMMNMASPEAAYRWWRLPVDGIGLARMEFIVNNAIEIHPMALIQFDRIEGEDVRQKILRRTRGYEDMEEYFVDRLARGIGKIACSQYPDPVIVRMSDFKTNEYADLIGGSTFENPENNPMLGFRGASRYYSSRYREGFGLECRAMKRVRERLGFTNVILMIPFCRTVEEADKVLRVMGDFGLERGENDLKVYMMAEVPSNVVLAEEFARRFDGFSIGSNDLTQLVLGIDRDSTELSELFDERNAAVKQMISDLIEKAHRVKRPVGICGQAPSDYPEFAEFLVREGIDSLSLNPDSVVGVKQRVAEVESSLPDQGE